MPHRGARPASGVPTPATRVRPLPGAAARLLLGMVILLGLLGHPAPAHAQPASITNLANASTVTSSDEERIERYVSWHADRLAAGGEDAAEAVTRLLEPVVFRTATRSFRGAYARIAVDRMRRIADDPPTPHAATNAMNVLAKVGTTTALSALVDQADLSRQPSWFIRLAAARGARQVLEDDRNGAIDDRARLRASRDLAARASTETDARVLRYILLAILQADDEDLEPGTRGDIHQNLATAMASVAERASKDPALSAATGHAVAAARNAFVAMVSTRDVQLAFGRRLAPAMVDLLGAYEAHWPAEGDEAATARHALDIERLETTLGFLVRANNPSAQAPDPPAATAWTRGNRSAFSSAIGSWRAAIR